MKTCILGWETHGERLAISSKKNHHSFRIQKVMFTLQNEIHIACQLGWQDHTRSYKIPMSRCFKAMNNSFFIFGSLPMKGRPSSDLARSPRTQHFGFDPICHTLSSNCAWMLDIFWLVVLNMASWPGQKRWKVTMLFMGKSTISMTMASIAMLVITRGYIFQGRSMVKNGATIMDCPKLILFIIWQ